MSKKVKGCYMDILNPISHEIVYTSDFRPNIKKEDYEFDLDDVPEKVKKEILELIQTLYDGIEDFEDIVCDEDFWTNSFEYQVFKIIEIEKIVDGYDGLIGATVSEIINDGYYKVVNFILANGKKQPLLIETEGSYSDWWEVFVTSKPKLKITSYKEIEKNNEVIICFYDNKKRTVLKIKGIFHNDSCWNYGCYLKVICNDLGINELYYC